MYMAMICLVLLSNKTPELLNIHQDFITTWNHHSNYMRAPSIAMAAAVIKGAQGPVPRADESLSQETMKFEF